MLFLFLFLFKIEILSSRLIYFFAAPIADDYWKWNQFMPDPKPTPPKPSPTHSVLGPINQTQNLVV